MSLPVRSALIIFAREPRLGQVKTRLQKKLPPSIVQQLYKSFVTDVCEMAATTRPGRFLFYTGGKAIPFLTRFKENFILRRQNGKDLGRRMFSAFAYCKKRGYEKTIIIGTDCLTLTKSDIARAFKVLSRYDCVIGPAKDGGYYLIGLRIPRPELFAGVRWGSGKVLKQTTARLRRANLSFRLLPLKEDLDTHRSLKKFYRSGRRKLSSKSCYAILQKLFGEEKYDQG